MEKTGDQQIRTESQTQLVEQINSCLHSGQYSRALDLLRDAAEFPNDAQLSELEKLAHDGVKRNAEAQRLITESQELFAQEKSAEAIQLLRKAYDLDKNNSLARSILANALVEHAHSLVETDWLEAEKLANQALNLNAAHPTAKSILSRIVYQKETSPVSAWIAQASKLQSSGDLFAALAWVAEGLAVHPHEPKLLQIQEEIQRDQDAKRRQARRGDLEELRRLQREIDGAGDVAAKKALAERIQAVAAKYWTDGEILSIANALLLRLGLTQESSSGSPRSKGAAVILHVPRPSAAEAAPTEISRVAPSPIQPSEVPPGQTATSRVAPTTVSSTPVSSTAALPPSPILPSPDLQTPTPPSVSPASVTTAVEPPNIEPSHKAPPATVPLRIAPRGKIRITPPEPQLASPQAAVPSVASSAPVAKTSPPSKPKQITTSNSAKLIIFSAVAIILVAVTFYFTRRHYAALAAKTHEAAPVVTTPAVSASAQATPAPSPPASLAPTDTDASKITPDVHSADDQPPAESVHNVGTLLVVTGQDGAKVFLNGKLQPQRTQAGQLRVTNLDLRDYVVQVSKGGFQDPASQKIRIRNGEQAKLVFNLQPQPQPLARLASLAIQGGAPGSMVLVDQTLVGTIQPDGTLSVASVNPGDHTIELHKERFKPRQLKKHFVAGETTSLTAADVALEAAPAELKVTFTPAEANVAISKGDLPKVISSGVPLNVAPGTYTLTARTADRITRVSTFEIVAGQSKTLDLSLAPNGMSKWDDPGAWKREGDSFIRKGGGFVLYGVVPASGTFAFSAMNTKGRVLQWVLDYIDDKNYVLFQMDENNFYRSVIRNGQKMDEVRVPEKGDKKSFRALQVRVSPTEIVHVIKHGDQWTVLDRWTPGTNLSLGKFGFYIPGDDQVALSSFAHYADLNIR